MSGIKSRLHPEGRVGTGEWGEERVCDPGVMCGTEHSEHTARAPEKTAEEGNHLKGGFQKHLPGGHHFSALPEMPPCIKMRLLLDRRGKALCQMQHHEGAQAAPLTEAVQVLTVKDRGARCHAWFCIWRAFDVTLKP